ncbi:hypothetical protein ACJMK2_010350 [Sinanodonta woodiana]|uniref:Protein naked cuticle homolog n=1 Tax=Sinanodonta woodiana TaxID=1069815 RepID=A0ABD3VF23_SINWO
MGKNASKHAAECFLVNAHLTGTLGEEIWKNTKTGFNLANYNMNHSLSELSICLEEKQENIPLKVDLPPAKIENDTSKVLLLDQNETDGKGVTEHTAKSLNIEEVECGVQFGGLDNKQEWSFTLYDFDGHGKITKEDLSSLLKALYDAVGSSIKIPSNGTRTLKLRLTVGPDGSYSKEARAVCNKENFPKESKKDTPTKDSPRKKDKIRFKDASSKVKSSSKVKEFSKLNNLTRTNVKCTNETQVGQSGVKPKIPLCPQISTQEHQQLADLVQANMERNQIRQLRRQHSNCKNNPQEQSHQKRHHRSHHNNLGNNISNNDNHDQPKESQDRRNYYLDLAGIENNTSKFQPTASALPTEQKNGSPSRRSRSQETKCENVKREFEQNNRKVDNSTSNRPDHLRSRSFDPQENGQSPKGNPVLNVSSSTTKPQRERGFRPFSLPAHLPEMVSPHHHRRHRHRDKDHDLAMQQVAEWIEREHSWDMEGDQIVIQRHQHHHVHEHHHHHHYHHYYEA